MKNAHIWKSTYVPGISTAAVDIVTRCRSSAQSLYEGCKPMWKDPQKPKLSLSHILRVSSTQQQDGSLAISFPPGQVLKFSRQISAKRDESKRDEICNCFT